jgi:hypothetical protein
MSLVFIKNAPRSPSQPETSLRKRGESHDHRRRLGWCNVLFGPKSTITPKTVVVSRTQRHLGHIGERNMITQQPFTCDIVCETEHERELVTSASC